MGWRVGILAIKERESNEILDVINEYYNQYNLSLVEERIGDRSGKYAKSKKWYKNLEDYSADLPIQRQFFTTNFEFNDALQRNKWKVCYDNLREAQYTLSINSQLTEFISKKLQATTFQYLRFDITGMHYLKSYENGNIEDIFEAGDLEVTETQGFFDKFEKKQYGSEDEILHMVEEYFIKIDFNLEEEEIDGLTRRPMYLKGHPDDILYFFQNVQVTF